MISPGWKASHRWVAYHSEFWAWLVEELSFEVYAPARQIQAWVNLVVYLQGSATGSPLSEV